MDFKPVKFVKDVYSGVYDIDESDITDYSGFLNMFNGLEAFGGEGSRWEDIGRSLPDDPEEQIKMEVACIVLMDKPAKVLFAGMTSKQAKAMDSEPDGESDANKIVALKAKLVKIEEKHHAETIDAKKTVYGGIVDRLILEIAELEMAAEDREDEADAAEADEDYEAEPDAQARADSVRLNTAIAGYLPKLSISELDGLDAESRKSRKISRKKWAPEFQNVNMSKAKRIGLMSLQNRKSVTKVHRAWIKKYGGRPKSCTCPENVNKETKEIFEAMILDFKANEEYWNKSAVKKIFNAKIKKRNGPVEAADAD